MPLHTNTPLVVPGPVLQVPERKPSRLTCRDEVLAAISRLMERTGDEVFTVARVFAEMSQVGTRYKESAVYKTMQRMKAACDEGCLERVGRQGFRLHPARRSPPRQVPVAEVLAPVG
jgi:hypothetical protein